MAMATVQSWLDSSELEKFGSHRMIMVDWCWLLWYPAASLIDWRTLGLGEIFSQSIWSFFGPGSALVLQTRRFACPEFQNFFLLETLKSLKFGWSPLVQCDKGLMDFLENVWEHCRCKWGLGFFATVIGVFSYGGDISDCNGGFLQRC